MDDCEAWLVRRPEPLAWPFAAIGLAGGWASNDMCQSLRSCGTAGLIPEARLDHPARLVLGASLALVYFFVGLVLSRSLKDGRAIVWGAPVAVIGAGFAAGYLNAFFVEDALALSAFASLIAAPWCALAAYGSTRAWQAREHTVAQRMYRRVGWLAVLGCAGLLVARTARRVIAQSIHMGSPWQQIHHGTVDFQLGRPQAATPWIIGIVACTLVIVAALSARDLFRVANLRRRMDAPRAPRWQDTERHDLGVGQGQVLLVARAGSYREPERVVAEVRGSFIRVMKGLVAGACGALFLVLMLAATTAAPALCR